MQIGRYRFVDRLAVGGMAEVFVAIAMGSEGFEKPVVIKRLLPHLAARTRFQQMFFDEARIMASLQHGNIVQILDMGKMDGVPFLALEYIDGKDLRTVLDRAQQGGVIAPHHLMAYVVSEVCRALNYAHRKRDELNNPLAIVHRDVNPANIFLSHEGMVKVGDFGLAKARDNLEQSEVGLIKGKFSYLSPEQARGEEIDHRSDLFSLGTTLYEATCGVRPFSGANELEIIQSVRAVSFAAPSALNPDFPSRLEAVILKALQQDPADRYATAGEMQADLMRYLQEQPVIPNDRHLAEYLDGLFRAERRSQSFLIRLAPVDTLPDPVMSIERDEGIAVFGKPGSPPPTPRPRAGGPAAGPPPLPGAAARTPVADPAMVVERPPSRGSGAMVIVAAIFIGGAIIAAILLMRVLQPATASLSITSSPPGATVLVNGKVTGQRTPMVLNKLTLNADFLVKLRHPEAGETERRFRFEKGEAYVHAFTLPAYEEVLSLTSQPSGVTVSVDGASRGQTPLSLRLRRGQTHVILLQKSGYRTKIIHHEAQGRSKVLALELELEAPPPPAPTPTIRSAEGPAREPPPATGTLELVTGVQARVHINGKYAGRTPGFQMQLPVGRHHVRVTPADGNIRHQAVIEIHKGQTNRVTLTQPE